MQKDGDCMKFGVFLLRVDRERDASLEDLIRVHEIGRKIFQPEGQKNLYVIETNIIDNRFFWLACDYDDATSFREYVIDQDTGEKEENPRRRSQVEPRKQFFACYDTVAKLLYIYDLTRRNTLANYMQDAIQKDFLINNVYASVEEFCERIKTIRGFQYTQVRNLFSLDEDIFSQAGDLWGLDAPEKLKIKVTYGDVPVREGNKLFDWFRRNKDHFEDVIIIGCDDQQMEQTFDFSSVIKRVEISPVKDQNGRYDPTEVKDLLLAQLRSL